MIRYGTSTLIAIASCAWTARTLAAVDDAADDKTQDPEGAALAQGARLDAILRLALARNPEIDEGRLRAAAAELGGRAAARLPEPELKYEQWGVPLARPWALDRSDTLMLGVRQALPGWGTRAARARVADEDTGTARESARGRRLDVIAQVRRAFAEYARTDAELALHREHVGLTSKLVELARQNYQTGKGTQQEVLRLSLELSRLHADLARIEQERSSSRALLNALMGRAPDVALGPPNPLALPAAPPTRDVLEKDLDRNRVEIASAARTIRRDEAALDLRRREARAPSFMIGLDYWYMPMNHDKHGYGAMVSMSLPWLGGRRGDEIEQNERTLRADAKALQATRSAARFELFDAAARVEAAQQHFAILDRDLLPQARRSYQAAEASYAVGQGDGVGLLDSLRSLLQVRVERIRALAHLHSTLADLDRAAGREVVS